MNDQQTTGAERTPITEPLFRVLDYLKGEYAQAQAAELSYSAVSSHRQDWTRRAEAVLRGWIAWEAFMKKEFGHVE